MAGQGRGGHVHHYICYLSVFVCQGLNARGNVEVWLGKVEEAMFMNLRKLVKLSISDFLAREREDWVLLHCSQVVLTVSQIMWCRDVTEILEHHNEDERLDLLTIFEQKNFQVSSREFSVRSHSPCYVALYF